jgi:hypothetical protein
MVRILILSHHLLKRRKFTSASFSTSLNRGTDQASRDDLLHDAAYLTKSLYRRCFRSIRVIRWGNTFDDKEFEKREEEFQNPTAGSRISMSPPPNRDDELRSRAEYYQSYAREYFTQESDCLDNDPLLERDFRRYLYYLRKGETDRKWLLGDMMFSDPYKNSIDQERIDKMIHLSKIYFGEDDSELHNEDTKLPKDSNDGFIDDEDPDWFRKDYPNLR